VVVACVVEVVVASVVVVVVITAQSGVDRKTRSLAISCAKNAPSSTAPFVIFRVAFGAQRTACVWALREMWTRGPFEKMRTWQGVALAGDDGPTWLPLSNVIMPVTLICTGPSATS